ncbi:MAG: hypothetical protein IJR80_01030 [Treponema sp.]|nr:hypothetical protein [Treponema sp.]
MNKLRFVVIPLLLLLVIGCENSVQTMLDDYNSNFTVTHAVEDGSKPSPGDSDFVASEMLYPIYYVSSDDTLNLAAPYNCRSYRWVLTDPTENYDPAIGPTEIDLVMFNGTDKVSRTFVAYMPDSITAGILEIGKTYKLTLTVTEKNEEAKSYTDIAAVVVYKNYDF